MRPPPSVLNVFNIITIINLDKILRVGGFNPSEKYESQLG
jgi:hypothetical protein